MRRKTVSQDYRVSAIRGTNATLQHLTDSVSPCDKVCSKRAAMGLRCSRFFGLVLLLSVAEFLHSQSPAPESGKPVTTLKSKVRLVVVDAVVTNGKGDAVPGLQKQDFEVLEDGKEQTVSSFEEHRGAAPTQIKLPPLPPGVYTNFPTTQTQDSVNVVLLDALNTPARDQSYVHAQMLKYLKTIPPGTRVAIFTLASRLRMIQGATTDNAELLAALNGAKSTPSQSALLPSNAETDAYQRLIDFMLENSGGSGAAPATLALAAVDPINAMKQFLADTTVFQTENRIRITLEALQQLARYLKDVPGRKNVIWFSGSFPINVFPDPDLPEPFDVTRSFEADIRKTADLLAAGQVALYPIAAEGLASDSAYEVSGTEIGEKRPSLALQDQIRKSRSGGLMRDSNHLVMDELASETGGHAYYNTNGLNETLARVIDNGTHYYTLTYMPSNPKMDGKFRHIHVKLVNAKYSLAYRRGYFADDLEAVLGAGSKPEADPLMPLIGRNLPNYTQVLYKLLVQPSNPQPPPDAARAGSTDIKGPFTRYSVDFAISVGDLKLEPEPDGARRGAIEVALIAYDVEGKPLNLVATRGEVRLSPEEYASAQKAGLQIHKEIDVPNGDTYLRTGIYDMNSSAAGTLGVRLTHAETAAK
jgi:VWFA-related protein